MPKLKSIDVTLKVPEVFELKGTWEADEAQQLAAWEIYVELVTRIAVVELQSGAGVLREALTSLHDLFQITREVLRRGGPGVARPAKKGALSLGMIAVDILNLALRPFLSRWHAPLLAWEAKRPEERSVAEHEAAWPKNEEMRTDLRAVQAVLRDYADLLGTAAGVPPLVLDRGSGSSQ
jgi:hypothetical protein